MIDLKSIPEVNHLIEYVNYIFSCDVMSKKRYKNIVYARITISSILRHKGYTLTAIGNLLSKDHSTITHYMSEIDNYLKYDKTFKKQYEIVAEKYKKNKHIPFVIRSKEDLEYIESLENEIKLLNLQRDKLKDQVDAYKNRIHLKEDLYKMIDERVRLGTEEQIKVKLNRFFNSVYDKK